MEITLISKRCTYVPSSDFSITDTHFMEKEVIQSTGTKASPSSLSSLVLAIASLQEPDSRQMKAGVTESHTTLRESMWWC